MKHPLAEELGLNIQMPDTKETITTIAPVPVSAIVVNPAPGQEVKPEQEKQVAAVFAAKLPPPEQVPTPAIAPVETVAAVTPVPPLVQQEVPAVAEPGKITFLDRANVLRTYGIPCIPLRPKTKIAILSDWPIKATTDPMIHAQWRKDDPEYNCAALFKAEPNGFWALETDSPETAQRYEAETGKKMPVTLTVQSREGRGHRYFANTLASIAMGNIGQAEASGFSVRVNNAYCVSPLSVHPDTGTLYKVVIDMQPIPATDDFVAWLVAQRKAKPLAAEKSATWMDDDIVEGTRDNTLFKIGAALRHSGLGEEEIHAILAIKNQKQCVNKSGDPYLKSDQDIDRISKSAAGYEIAQTTMYGGGVPRDGVDGLRAKIEADLAQRSADGEEAQKSPLVFKFEKTVTTPETAHLDFAFGPSFGQWEGLFPRSDLSMIAASSGGGKSTFMFDALDRGRQSETLFGHARFGLPFLLITYDRGELSGKRTMKRMGLEGREEDFPTEHIPPTSQDVIAIAQKIIESIEKQPTMPVIVFIEGGDIASVDPSKSGPTKQFVSYLQEIARYYHIAFVLSVGVPKLKVDQEFAAQRDNIFGSSFWARMCETIITIHEVRGDPTGAKRTMFIMGRHAPQEKLNLMFNKEGRLILDPDGDSAVEPKQVRWFREHAGAWFTAACLVKGIGVSRSEAHKMCRAGVADGYIRTKPGPKSGPGAGIKEYKWIDQPVWVPEESPDGNGEDGLLDGITWPEPD